MSWLVSPPRFSRFSLRHLLAAVALLCAFWAALTCRTEPPVERVDGPVPAAVTDDAAGAPAGGGSDPATERSPGEHEPGRSATTIVGESSAVPESEVSQHPAAVRGTAEGPRKVLILGDSLAATGFGVLLQKKLNAHPDIRCNRKAKSASGLARPDFFDWMGEAKRQVKSRQPDLVIVIMGGNDGQDLTSKRKRGRRVVWKSDGWEEAYGRRVTAFLDVVGAEQRQVLWLGLPQMGMRSLERKLVEIRNLQQAAVDARGKGSEYVPTTPLLARGGAKLPTYVKVRNKKRTLREDDGIHFTMSGSEYFAAKVYPEVLRVLRLTARD